MLLDPSPQRILIAEDDAAIQELLVTRLEIAGYRTLCASDGATALQLARTNSPAAAILDVNMPRMDGFSVLKALRDGMGGSSLPVLMLTARRSSADVEKARAYGANDYLTKPFDDRQLLTRLERMIRSRVRLARG